MNKYSRKQVYDIILGYVLEAGESLWEEMEGDFDGNQHHYLDFLLKEEYITQEQHNNWLKYEDLIASDWCDNIERMTYYSRDEYPDELMEEHGVIKENYELDVNKAKELGLINVPILIDTPLVSDFNKIYWEKVLGIIAHYLYVYQGEYSEILESLNETVNYYKGV